MCANSCHCYLDVLHIISCYLEFLHIISCYLEFLHFFFWFLFIKSVRCKNEGKKLLSLGISLGTGREKNGDSFLWSKNLVPKLYAKLQDNSAVCVQFPVTVILTFCIYSCYLFTLHFFCFVLSVAEFLESKKKRTTKYFFFGQKTDNTSVSPLFALHLWKITRIFAVLSFTIVVIFFVLFFFAKLFFALKDTPLRSAPATLRLRYAAPPLRLRSTSLRAFQSKKSFAKKKKKKNNNNCER